MLDSRFMSVVAKEGVVSIVTCADNEAHVVNTWNSYLEFTEDNKILIPAYGMVKTRKKAEKNNRILMTLGTKEIEGKMGPGTGYLIEGTGEFMRTGEHFDRMKKKFDWTNRVLVITPELVKQTI